MGVYKSYVIFNIVCSCLMILIYVVTLCKVNQGTNYTFVTTLIVLLLLSNIANIVLTSVGKLTIDYTENEGDLNIFFWVWVQGGSTFVANSSMIVAYWIFAFEYYSIARMMPFAINGSAMPEQ